MGKKVLLAVLDWGLGHATRSSVIIREVIRQGHTPLVMSSGEALRWIQTEFPGLKTFSLPPLRMKYFSLPGALISAAWYTPRLFWIMYLEKRLVEKIVDQEKIDLIVSDNRYGCHHSMVRSVLVCHFLNIVLPGKWKIISPVLNFFYRSMFRAFDEIWVPDDEEGRLSGELSEAGFQYNKLKFIGPLSRFKLVEPKKEKTYDVTAIISGPEPLKSRFAEKIFSSLSGFPGRCLVVVGGNKLLATLDEKIELRYNASTKDLGEIVQNTSLVISRSGYSSIMDFDRLQCRVLMVPTPGQPEQIYLARLMYKRGYAAFVDEEELDPEIIRENMTSEMIFRGSSSSFLLESQIRQSLI